MSLNVTEFVPKMNFAANEFKPTASAMSTQASVYQPKPSTTAAAFKASSTFVPTTTTATTKPPEVVKPPPPPPKEKSVLLLERIVKGSNTDVPAAELSADDSKKVSELSEPLTAVKKAEGKITVELLHKLCDVMKSVVVKLPENLVKVSVHKRLIARGDEGEDQPLYRKPYNKTNSNVRDG